MEIRRKRGRPSQDKIIRHYSLHTIIANFIDALPDGERSRFVNNILRQDIEIERLSGRFYVYLLMRPDGSVFYVGKGTRGRISDHEREARNGVQSHQCNIIRKVWAEGHEIIKQKIAFFVNEEDAYELETLLIKFFGKGDLANISDGGEGPSTLEDPIRTNINLDTEDIEGIARIRNYYGLANDASAIRFAIRKVAREIEKDVSSTSGEHRQDTSTR